MHAITLNPLKNRQPAPTGAGANQSPDRLVPRCRFCGHEASVVMADLGMQPIANALRRPQDLNTMEPTFPLKAVVCGNCLLVQALEVQSAQNLFAPDYLYFSSFSETMLAHARQFAEQSIARFGLNASSHVVEVACNDGYLLKWFRAQDIPVLGIEPAVGTARAAKVLGIPVRTEFFGKALAASWPPKGCRPTCCRPTTSSPMCRTSMISSVASRSCSSAPAWPRSSSTTCSSCCS
ncbi:MAG: hypothetical protein R3E68_02045 [Burkholderiaceae bacterium]